MDIIKTLLKNIGGVDINFRNSENYLHISISGITEESIQISMERISLFVNSIALKE